ncbi:hypothetical protein [Hyunsoonleella ulvae]|uniref:hypothetical protein n=1 Tax=Hyunsoonleella ulvae TaxID=2799948 RepID=UPI0019396B1E|nr:hypothetical protein [Hyunsoonleella ulvae]
MSIIFCLGLTYLNTRFFIEKQTWKYGEGTHIGDWLSENNFRIENGHISSYRGKAKIVFSNGKYLIIRDVKAKGKGIYVNKNL